MSAPSGTVYGYVDQFGVVRPLHQLVDWPAAAIAVYDRWTAPAYADGSHGPWTREGQSTP